MKKFLSLVLCAAVGSFLILGSASAMEITLDDWAFNPNGSGYGTSLNPIDELNFTGTSFINNTGLDAGSTFTQLGTFYTLGFKNDNAPVNPDGDLNGEYELTAVLSAQGKNTSRTGDDVDFSFTGATLNFYIDYTPDYGTTDGFYGADEGSDGKLIASFSLLYGGGNLDFGEADGNTDITFQLETMLEGYFFDQNGDDLALYDDDDKLLIGMTDSNNDIVDPSDIQKSEWADKDMDVDSGDPNDIWTDTDGSFSLAVPEPGTMMLFGLGLLGFAGVGRRKIRA